MPVQHMLLGCTFFGDHRPSFGLPFGTSLGKNFFFVSLILLGFILVLPLPSWKVLERIGLFPFCTEKYWNNLVCSCLFLKSFGIPTVCSSSFLKILQRLCLFPFDPEKFWNTFVCYSLFPRSFGTLLFAPLCSWNFLELSSFILFNFEDFGISRLVFLCSKYVRIKLVLSSSIPKNVEHAVSLWFNIKKNQRIEATFRFRFDPNGMPKLRWLLSTTFTSYNRVQVLLPAQLAAGV